MKKYGKFTIFVAILLAFVLMAAMPMPQPQRQSDNPNSPAQPVKLIFIHHSTGENWLMDGYGNLGRTLGQNNYFVSDTNYGWGPDSIGDRTDIPNWTEWFASENTPIYMSALFNESGQNSDYTRTLPDPGGENQIVMFKSCFPNSELEGNPNDPPGTYEEMSVGGAKYVYNQLLGYFAARPDKLFIVITAPPVSNPEYAANARAFNNWLVNDWLRENNYTLDNVAVFDFYNILTDPNAHHRVNNGQVEHIVGGDNTLYYSSDDDHPSAAGSQKATEEFIPMLNVFYHRWVESAPLQTAPQPASSPQGITPAEEAPQPELYPAQPLAAGLIDDFETDNPPGTNGWEPFWDEATLTSMHCTAEPGNEYAGNRSLILDFEVTPDSWATCALFYDSPQNLSAGEGISFFYKLLQSIPNFEINLYVDGPDGQESYVYSIETTQAGADSWIQTSIPWSEFKRVDWEANAGTPFAKQAQVSGLAFGFGSQAIGTIWVDDLSLLGAEPVAVPSPLGEPQDSQPVQPSGRPALPCLGSLTLPLLLAGLVLIRKRRVM